ncbi:MAG: hypothetical protein HY731_12250 [Candidatus Tectomicrobia bacterium]|nr:hypothetical protein [Candidatus Tectomicrobia bacterium]
MNQQNGFTQQQKEMRTIVSGIRRPNWICQNVRQRVTLVRDKSGSMSGQKAEDASAASQELVAELAQAEDGNPIKGGDLSFWRI